MHPTQNRTRIYVFHGTWADPNSKPNDTILSAITDLIVKTANIEIRHIPGVGTRNGRIEKYIGGGFGSRAVKDNIIDAISDLATNYRPDDEIVIIGYSRGAYAARSFIGFLDRVGLPGMSSQNTLHDLFERYTTGQFLKRGMAPYLRRRHNCVHVQVKIAICIDTVGSLGIPYTGVFGLFKILKPFVKKHEFMETNASSNVDVLLHALALHENRRPFKPTLMHIRVGSSQSLQQVWFPASHSDVAREDPTGCIADAVLAWLIAHLESNTAIKFDDEKVSTRFPLKNSDGSSTIDQRQAWVHDSVSRSYRSLWKLLGHVTRVPGSWCRDGMQTCEAIHPAARLRGYGRVRDTPAVPGYSPEKSQGVFVWKRKDTGRQSVPSRFDEKMLATLPEAVLSPRELESLGLEHQ